MATGCAWDAGTSVATWLTPRVIELGCTSDDMRSAARNGSAFLFKEERRELLRADIDAAMFHLYGLERIDVEYVLDAFQVFRRADVAAHGEYRTKRVILEIYDAMVEATRTGRPYQTRLDPPPADPRVAHPDIRGSKP